jgi:hypothetical protein
LPTADSRCHEGIDAVMVEFESQISWLENLRAREQYRPVEGSG